jgi:PAS domain S-box-containing protein
MAEMLGVERSKLTGHHLADFVAPAEQGAFHIFCQRLRSSRQPQQCEINLKQRDQTLFVAKLNGMVLSQNGEKTIYYIAVSDVTVEKQSDLQRLELAGEHQRTRILANFINDMSHDLRTPLTKIVTGLYLVGKTTDQELRLDKIEKINTQLFSLADLLEQLQTMAVLDSLCELKFQHVGINSVLADVIAAVKASAEAKNIDIISNFQKDLSKILLNADNMFLALLNLVSNAIQFTPVGGLISLTTQQRDQHVMIEIADNGIGIPTDILPHIFERFFKADVARTNATGGAGLGLSLAKRVIELHRGRIEVSSSPGIRTIFQITLPLNQP